MGQTDLKPTAQGQVESSINDTINFIMAKVAAGEIDAATATELIAAARKDYESNVPVTTSAQQAVQPQQTANPYQADPQTAYVRTQAAGTFDIDGISEDMSALLGDSRSIIEDFLREQCALYYPTAVEAECNGILTADFNANEYRVDFSLKDTEDQQLTGITVVYHLSTKQCELM